MSASLLELWRQPAAVPLLPASLPRTVYLARVIPSHVAPAATVHLRMHGEIRLKQWKPFFAREVIHRDRGFLWKARVGGMIIGSDSLLDGNGRSAWKLFGLFPVARAEGPDIDRSATGRWLAESLLLPSMLLPEHGAVWEGSRVTLSRFGESAAMVLKLDAYGRLREFRMERWGNPGGGAFGYHPFGSMVEEERIFDGYTIPSRLRLGWHFGTPRWEEGEFFRMTVDEAIFR